MSKPDIAYLRRIYKEANDEANEWFDEGKRIQKFILPKHGRFNSSPPHKKRFSSKAIVNPVAGDALNILTSGMHGRLTGQNRQWCQLSFVNNSSPPSSILRTWLYEAQKRLHTAWQLSNFYEVMPIYYKELAGFGTASMHVGESDTRIFHFDLLTYGEFVFTLGVDGRVDKFFRYIDFTARQLELYFGRSALPAAIQEKLKEKTETLFFYRVIHCVYEEPHLDKPYRSVYFLEGGPQHINTEEHDKPLRVSGYYEFPFPTARWETIGSDSMGYGLGSDILPLVMRLQEMDKSFLVATHKAVNPAYNVPARLRGKVQTLPGGMNYVANVQEKVEPIVNTGFEYQGVLTASEKVEQDIRKICYNDVFLTGMRDPNASPLKARQVDQHEDESVIRLGPIIGRLYSDALSVIVTRCFNSMLRRGMFPPIDPEMLREAGAIDITLIGPLAQQQKLIEVRSINTFFSFLAAAVPFDERFRDKINVDRTVDEVADMTGVPSTILATDEEVQQAREARMQEMEEQKQMQRQMVEAEMQAKQAEAASKAAKNYADAGVAAMGGGMM